MNTSYILSTNLSHKVITSTRIDLHFGMSDSLEHEYVLGWWLLGGFLRIVLIRLLFAICLYVSSGGADTRGVRVCRQREVKL